MSPKSLALEEQRSRLERRANVIRSRLLRTIDALDNRRHQVQEIGRAAKRFAVPALATVLGVALVAAGTTFAIRAVVERQKNRHFSYRLAQAIAPFRTIPKPPLWKDALRKVTLTLLGVVAAEVAKRGARALLEKRLPEGAPAAPALVAGTSLPTGNGSSTLPTQGK